MGTAEAAKQFVFPIVAPLLGKTVWGASLGVGSFITAEFGKAVSPRRTRARAHGEWHLWITYDAWRIERGPNVLAACEDQRPRLESAIEGLNGLALLSIDVLFPAMDTLFTFDSDVKLRLFPIYSDGYEHWQLFTPDGNVLTIGPGSSWSYKNSELP